MTDLDAGAAWIVGGSSGIGRAVAGELHARGRAVVVSALDVPELEQVDERWWNTSVDTRDSRSVAEAYALVSGLVPVGAVVNCAGVSPVGSVMTLTDEDWHLALDTKLLGYARICRTVLPDLSARGGALVNVIGSAAHVATADYAVGCIAAALNHLTRGIAQEWCRQGVRVYGISPGPTATERLTVIAERRAADAGIPLSAAWRELTGDMYAGAPLRPQDLALTIAELLGPAGAALNGSILLADGGATGGWI